VLFNPPTYPAYPRSIKLNKVIHEDLVMTRKKVTTIPLKSITPAATAAVDDFLTEIANINPTTLHFFDESSVIKTTGNRK